MNVNRYSKTTALAQAQKAMDLSGLMLEYMSDGRGKPAKKQQSLYAASIVFSYGIWENYVEELCMEFADWISEKIHPSRIPAAIKSTITKGEDAWAIGVHPGWRELWKQKVRKQAVGDEETKSFGLNTARAPQVEGLLKLTGAPNALNLITFDFCPAHLLEDTPENNPSLADAIDSLVSLRGEIVHTGSVPKDLRKKHVLAWQTFVSELILRLDKATYQDCSRHLVPIETKA